MIIIKSDAEIEQMRIPGKVTGKILHDLADYIKPGMSTWDIDHYVEEYILDHKMTPTFKGYGGFPAAACISVNEEVIHGIPDKKRILQEGDIVSVDTGATFNGFVSDAARTYGVGEISPEARRLIQSTEESFFAGIQFAKTGQRLLDISHAIQEKAEGDGYSVIRDYCGHGVGRELHEDPNIPNYGKAGRGPRLRKGMVFAIEPMICEGSYSCRTLGNRWTVVTVDGGLAAHYENSLVITDGEPELLTLYREE